MTSRTWGPDGSGIPISTTNLNGIEADLDRALGNKHTTVTSNYSMAAGDSVVIGNGSSITVTLPDPTTVANSSSYAVKNSNATALTVNSAGTSKTIDGASSVTLGQWDGIRVVSDGTQWLVSARSGAPWATAITASGSSMTNWTGVSGTWTSDGTSINVTTNSTKCRVKLNTPLPAASPLCVDFQVNITSMAGGGADMHAGLLLGYDGTSTNAAAAFRLGSYNSAPWAAQMEQDGSSARGAWTYSVSANTWYKVRAVWTGSVGSLYVNGVLQGTTWNLVGMATSSPFYLGLFATNVAASFKNITVSAPVINYPAFP